MLIEFFGYFGATLLTFSAVPQLFKTIKTKEVDDLSPMMLLTWAIGCLSMFVYVMFRASQETPLLFNYFFNSVISGWILYLFYRYKNK